jgi:hypothetical protein|eukprot:TRINITY_DN61288_c0_g1_i1.p1 TRINITY_DN61288_c0_g1~~TRINITY_DN61288_c0_g1_i1.p1  ORF type:complete len:726 (+),score=166.71 TRINITY_DN61288_c0_g1_i1:79-2256(+)
MRYVAYLICAAAVQGSFAVVSVGTLSPVTRVVELLKSLAEKIEQEGKEEESLYKKFICWGTTTVEEKTASNAAAESRLQSLKSYVADIEAGRIEFTSERTDLEKELAQLNSDIETAATVRSQETKDFESAKAEMDQSISALETAIRVLSEATQPGGAQLLGVKRLGVGGYAALTAEATKLVYAADLGARVLSHGDSRFLRRLLTADVPTKDWKKLNRKAVFKEKYEARSTKIQEVLSKLLETFKANLSDANKKEQDAQTVYDKLSQAKAKEKGELENSLSTLEKEGSARGLSKQEANQEIADLEKQVADDSKYITETQSALDEKKSQWQTRSELRSKETAAIGQAIAVLHSDDARDVFKRSFKSQGYSLLQVHKLQSESMRSRGIAAASVLRRAMAALSNANAGGRTKELARIASRIVSKNGFDTVIAAIDRMLTSLRDEETTELSTKETCESDRAADTRDALVQSRAADELTDTERRLENEVEQNKAEVAGKYSERNSTQQQLSDATKLREDEAHAFTSSKADDEQAVSLVEQAHTVLQQFYKDNGLMLVEKRRAPGTEAGNAPPAPPSTWEGSYGGHTDSSTGILSILTMIKDDIKADLNKAQQAEDLAQSDFDELKTDLEKSMTDLQAAIDDLLGVRATKLLEIEEVVRNRKLKVEGLKIVLDRLKAAQSGCDFVLINYKVRSSNRKIEIDGLEKAKAILKGAKFPDAGNPSMVMLGQHPTK